MKTIAIDFDGVIHKYSGGWKDGSIYDEPIEGAFEAIKGFMRDGYSVFIFSTRSPRQIKKWLNERIYGYWGPLDERFIRGGFIDEIMSTPTYGFTVEIIPFWKNFWDKPKVLGITKRKLPAIAYIDDRAVKFNGDWSKIKIDYPPSIIK